MTTIKTICLIGFGEVGSSLARDLLSSGNNVQLTCYDVAFTNPDSKASHNKNKLSQDFPQLTASQTAKSALENADLVISVVTAEQALAAATSVLDCLKANTWYWDLNSVSPNSKKALSDLLSGKARFVEGAIMSPIQPKRIASPILLAGPQARCFATIASELGFTGSKFSSEELGKAAASKMCRSVIIKGMESLLTESLISARYYGVEDQVLESLNNLLPGVNWQQHSAYMISRSLEHGLRRSEEMHEAHKTVKDAGLLGLMSAACADTQNWTADFNQHVNDDNLISMLDQFREQL